jgi:pilus assembly protein CpaC
MHRRKNRMDAWVASAILVLSLSPAIAANAQEGFLDRLKGKFSGSPNTMGVATATQVASTQTTDDSAAAVDDSATMIAETRKVSLVMGQTKRIPFPDIIKRVSVDNREFVDPKVNKNNLRELFVMAIASKPGAAQIIVTDRNNRSYRIDVAITADAGPLQMAIEESFPHTNVRAIPVGESGVLMTGFVDNPQEIGAILGLAEKIYPGGVVDNLKAVGPQQVQLRVMIAEVNRTKLRALGVNFLATRTTTGGRATYFDSIVGGLVTESADASSPIGLAFKFNDQANILYGKLGQRHEFRAFIRALKEEGLAKIVAEPTLVTFSGRAASMVVGGEFPIIVPGQQGTFTVEFREYGNRLEFVPIVLGGGRIRLEVRPELSQLDYANGVVMQGFTIPGIIQRRIDTSLELNTGETYIAGGLISTGVSSTTSKLPYIGDMPLIGSAFRTVSYSEEEKELVIMVTPELVEPLRPGQKPCGYPGSESTHPSDGELYCKGNVEVPVCNECEISRRAELNIALDHAHHKAPCVPRETAAANEKTRATAAPPPASASVSQRDLEILEIKTPPSSLAPVKLQGLIGPTGYDAGR